MRLAKGQKIVFLTSQKGEVELLIIDEEPVVEGGGIDGNGFYSSIFYCFY